MTQSFLDAFSRISDYDFLWKTEQTDIKEINRFKNVHLRRWIQQKELISLLIYNIYKNEFFHI
jgi:hypothetical protein